MRTSWREKVERVTHCPRVISAFRGKGIRSPHGKPGALIKTSHIHLSILHATRSNSWKLKVNISRRLRDLLSPDFSQRVLKVLFCHMNRTMDSLPPTLNSLLQHKRRAVYQALIWTTSTQPQPITARFCPDEDIWNLGTTVDDYSRSAQILQRTH